MILDPFGELLAEIRSFEDEITLADINKEKITLPGGWRYRNARRPDLYKDILGQKHTSATKPVWLDPEP